MKKETKATMKELKKENEILNNKLDYYSYRVKKLVNKRDVLVKDNKKNIKRLLDRTFERDILNEDLKIFLKVFPSVNEFEKMSWFDFIKVGFRIFWNGK